MLMSDLCRALKRPYSVQFVDASSYGDGRLQKDGEVKVGGGIQKSKYIDSNTGVPHKVVLVDELVDNGKTMHDIKQYYLRELSETHKDADVLTVCLFAKKRERTYPEADITGITDVPDLWLIGYGLDDRGTKRGWTELLAVPKVKIIETNDQSQVQWLLDRLDDSGVVSQPFVFAGQSLTHDNVSFRISGLDATRDLPPGRLTLTSGCEDQIRSKADLLRSLEGLPTVKGRYETTLRFAFIAENIPLVEEDEIFQGSYQTYARMRCALTQQITRKARSAGVEGPTPAHAP